MIADVAKAAVTFVCLLIAWATVPIALGEDSVSRDGLDRFGTPANGSRTIVGLSASKCSNCHSKSASVFGDELPPDVRGFGNDGWILGDELRTWVYEDYHYQAFTVLLNEQSQQIAKRLGIVDSQGQSMVHQDRRCLACHSSMPVNQMSLKDDRVIEDTKQDPRFTIGVSCEACHGPAGHRKDGRLGWEEAHVVDPRWRTMNPKAKFEEFGYWDIHSTRTQTRICLSCHLGNADQQKIITHEMYAAGHPPLPSFELSQFVHQMPRHWRRLDEKPKTLRDRYVKDLQRSDDVREFAAGFDPEELATTKITMIAALVTLEESMYLTADLIGNPSASSQWPELANYSCFACHHELRRDGWRRKTRLSKIPGRPTLHEWPFVLSRLVAEEMQENGAEVPLQAEVDAVIAAMTSRPYGDSSQLKNAAQSLAKAIEAQSRVLNSMTIHRDRGKAFLTRIASDASTMDSDYDGARQFVWAYERTLSALSELSLSAETQEVPLKAAVPQKWNSGNRILDEFDQSLVLWLRGNRKAETTVKVEPNKAPFQHPQRDTNITDALKKIANYEPQMIRDGFQELQKRPRSDEEIPEPK